jgi:hypothetical protein
MTGKNLSIADAVQRLCHAFEAAYGEPCAGARFPFAHVLLACNEIDYFTKVGPFKHWTVSDLITEYVCQQRPGWTGQEQAQEVAEILHLFQMLLRVERAKRRSALRRATHNDLAIVRAIRIAFAANGTSSP